MLGGGTFFEHPELRGELIPGVKPEESDPLKDVFGPRIFLFAEVFNTVLDLVRNSDTFTVEQVAMDTFGTSDSSSKKLVSIFLAALQKLKLIETTDKVTWKVDPQTHETQTGLRREIYALTGALDVEAEIVEAPEPGKPIRKPTKSGEFGPTESLSKTLAKTLVGPKKREKESQRQSPKRKLSKGKSSKREENQDLESMLNNMTVRDLEKYADENDIKLPKGNKGAKIEFILNPEDEFIVLLREELKEGKLRGGKVKVSEINNYAKDNNIQFRKGLNKLQKIEYILEQK